MAMSKPMTVLLTGSSGFVGRHVVARMKTEAVSVVPCDVQQGVDLLNVSALLEFPSVDAVIHLAANTQTQDAWNCPHDLYKDNFLMTLNVLEYCRQKQVPKIIFSSTYVYGVPRYLPVDEAHPIDPANPYTRSKWLCEELIKGFCADYGLTAFILRNFNVYGPGQPSRFLIPTIVEQLSDPSLSKIKLGDLAPKRDFVHVEDVVDAIWKCAIHTGEKGAHVYNIGTGTSTSVNELAELLFQLSGSRKAIEDVKPHRPNDVPDAVADIQKAEKELGWVPRYALGEGLRSLLPPTWGTGD